MNNKELFDILLGSLIGDGYAEKRGNTTRITWHHGVRQKDYLLWKCNKFKSVNLSSAITGYLGRKELNWFKDFFYKQNIFYILVL